MTFEYDDVLDIEEELPNNNQSSAGLENLTYNYLKYRSGRESLLKLENNLKSELLAVLSEAGEEDDKGNRFYYLGGTIEDIQGVKRERRVSRTLDEDKTLEVIKKYGLENECLETITVINEDAILAANFDGKISDEEMASLYTEKETFALILVKDKGK